MTRISSLESQSDRDYWPVPSTWPKKVIFTILFLITASIVIIAVVTYNLYYIPPAGHLKNCTDDPQGIPSGTDEKYPEKPGPEIRPSLGPIRVESNTKEPVREELTTDYHIPEVSYAPVVPGESEVTAEELRLSTDVVPESYDLKVRVFLPGYVEFGENENLTTQGVVTMKLNVINPTKVIELHSVDLTFHHSSCSLKQNGRVIRITHIEDVEKLAKIYVHLTESVNVGPAELTLSYKGKIRTDLSGIYQSKYTENSGKTIIAATTHMEPTDARKFVPCFDEPQLKATWKVTVEHPTGTTALSNSIEISTEPIDDKFVVTTFKESPKMSTYLVAVVVSEFAYVEKMTKRGTRFRVYSRKEAADDTTYPLEAGVTCIEYYEDLFGIPFPLEKQDMVAIPDFAAGAMENWGLITYRENRLLYNDRIFTPAQKLDIATVIAHELAHQWFGNLVTMEWWDALWLNEGFASYVEYLGVNAINKQFLVDDWFVQHDLFKAFKADQVAKSHPLSFRIDKASDVSEAFDRITYSKGGSILRMLMNTMGMDNFSKGLSSYLKAYSYSNAKPIDLFEHFDLNTPDDVIGPDGSQLIVSRMADQWTTQMGFPYVTATVRDENTVVLTQERYKINPEAEDAEEYANPKHGFKWDIPVYYKCGTKDEQLVWLPQNGEATIEHHDGAPLVLNVGAKAFYHMNYDKAGWESIIKQLNEEHTVYDLKSRYAIIADAFAMADIGKLDYETLFRLMDYIPKDKHYLPRKAFMRGLNHLEDNIGTDSSIQILRKFYLKQLDPNTFDEEFSDLVNNYRDDSYFYEGQLTQIQLPICEYGFTSCVDRMKTMFESIYLKTCDSDAMLSQCSTIAAPLRGEVYCTGVRTGDPAVFKQVRKWYLKETMPTEADRLAQALSCTQDPALLKQILNDCFDPTANFARLQDVYKIVSSVSKNDVGKQFLLRYLISNWEPISEYLKENRDYLISIIGYATGCIQSQTDVDKLNHFLSTTPSTKSYEKTFQKGLNAAQTRFNWVKNHEATVVAELSKRI